MCYPLFLGGQGGTVYFYDYCCCKHNAIISSNVISMEKVVGADLSPGRRLERVRSTAWGAKRKDDWEGVLCCNTCKHHVHTATVGLAVVATGYYVYHRQSMAADAEATRRTQDAAFGECDCCGINCTLFTQKRTGKFREKEPERKDEGYLTAPSKQDAINARPSPGVSSGSAV